MYQGTGETNRRLKKKIPGVDVSSGDDSDLEFPPPPVRRPTWGKSSKRRTTSISSKGRNPTKRRAVEMEENVASRKHEVNLFFFMF